MNNTVLRSGVVLAPVGSFSAFAQEVLRRRSRFVLEITGATLNGQRG